MENQKVNFKGIQNNAPMDEIENGTCSEIINLRVENGAWRPVGKKEKVMDLPEEIQGYKSIYLHVLPSGEKNYIAVRGNEIYKFDSNSSEKIGELNPTEEFISFKHIGNILLVITNQAIIKMLWNARTKKYGSMFRNFPDTPDYTLSVIHHTLRGSYESVRLDNVNEREKLSRISIRANYYKTLDKINENKYFAGYVCVRVAFRLFDGSFVMATIPKIRYVGGKMKIWNFFNDHDTNTIGTLLAISNGYLRFGYNPTNYNLEEWKDIIKSVCVFMTRPVSRYDMEKMNVDNKNRPDDKELATNEDKPYVINYIRDIKTDDLIGNNPYYLVKEIPIDKTDVVVEDIFIEKNIESNEVLGVDNLTHHGVTAKVSSVYNSRLVLGDTSMAMYKGQNPDSFAWGLSGFYNLGLKGTEVELSSNNSPVYVQNQSSRAVLTDVSEFEDVVGYPDLRAKSLRFFVKDNADNIKSVRFFDNLKKSNFGFAYRGPKYIDLDKSVDVVWEKQPKDVKIRVSVPGDDTYITVRLSEVDFVNTYLGTSQINLIPEPYDLKEGERMLSVPNKIKVSELYNPFVFPVKQTYTVGSEKIIDTSVNALPVSTGQFGQHPLFVFCTDGIFALQMGNADVLFSAVLPVNRDVATGKVLGLKTSSIFPTVEGLKVLRGQESELISEVINGEPINPLLPDEKYKILTNLPETYQILGVLKKLDWFKSYMQDAIMAYNPMYNEVIITNNKYPYSWVFSGDGYFYKISETFDFFFDDYPDTLAVKGNEIVNISKEDKGDIEIHLQTNPVKFNGHGFCLIERMRADVDLIAKENTKAGVYAYVSIDGRNWELVEGVNNQEIHNLLIQRISCSFIYVIFVIGANALHQSRINDIAVSVKSKYGNKVR